MTAEIDGRPTVRRAELGVLSAEEPEAVDVWAPGELWREGQAILAGLLDPLRADPRRSRLITDRPCDLALVAADVRVQLFASDDARLGWAGFRCADLRSGKLFRRLLRGGGDAEAAALLDLHSLLLTPHGTQLVERWRPLLERRLSEPDLALPVELEESLKEFEQRAQEDSSLRLLFHELNPRTKPAARWQEEAVAVASHVRSRVPEAEGEVNRWIDDAGDWTRMSPAEQDRQRRITASLLWLVVNNPWADAEEVTHALLEPAAAR